MDLSPNFTPYFIKVFTSKKKKEKNWKFQDIFSSPSTNANSSVLPLPPSTGKWKVVETMNNLQLQTWESGWLRPIPNKRKRWKWKRGIVRGEFSRNFVSLCSMKNRGTQCKLNNRFFHVHAFLKIFLTRFFPFFLTYYSRYRSFPPTIGCFVTVNYSHIGWNVILNAIVYSRHYDDN